MIFVEYAESQNCAVARERTTTTTVVRAQFTNLMRHVWVEFFGSTCSCSVRLTKVFLISIYKHKKRGRVTIYTCLKELESFQVFDDVRIIIGT